MKTIATQKHDFNGKPRNLPTFLMKKSDGETASLLMLI
jgi:hypothetical protein